jgi:hypothetical protein
MVIINTCRCLARFLFRPSYARKLCSSAGEDPAPGKTQLRDQEVLLENGRSGRLYWYLRETSPVGKASQVRPRTLCLGLFRPNANRACLHRSVVRGELPWRERWVASLLKSRKRLVWLSALPTPSRPCTASPTSLIIPSLEPSRKRPNDSGKALLETPVVGQTLASWLGGVRKVRA